MTTSLLWASIGWVCMAACGRAGANEDCGGRSTAVESEPVHARPIKPSVPEPGEVVDRSSLRETDRLRALSKLFSSVRFRFYDAVRGVAAAADPVLEELLPYCEYHHARYEPDVDDLDAAYPEHWPKSGFTADDLNGPRPVTLRARLSDDFYALVGDFQPADRLLVSRVIFQDLHLSPAGARPFLARCRPLIVGDLLDLARTDPDRLVPFLDEAGPPFQAGSGTTPAPACSLDPRLMRNAAISAALTDLVCAYVASQQRRGRDIDWSVAMRAVTASVAPTPVADIADLVDCNLRDFEDRRRKRDASLLAGEADRDLFVLAALYGAFCRQEDPWRTALIRLTDLITSDPVVQLPDLPGLVLARVSPYLCALARSACPLVRRGMLVLLGRLAVLPEAGSHAAFTALLREIVEMTFRGGDPTGSDRVEFFKSFVQHDSHTANSPFVTAFIRSASQAGKVVVRGDILFAGLDRLATLDLIRQIWRHIADHPLNGNEFLEGLADFAFRHGLSAELVAVLSSDVRPQVVTLRRYRELILGFLYYSPGAVLPEPAVLDAVLSLLSAPTPFHHWAFGVNVLNRYRLETLQGAIEDRLRRADPHALTAVDQVYRNRRADGDRQAWRDWALGVLLPHEPELRHRQAIRTAVDVIGFGRLYDGFIRQAVPLQLESRFQMLAAVLGQLQFLTRTETDAVLQIDPAPFLIECELGRTALFMVHVAKRGTDWRRTPFYTGLKRSSFMSGFAKELFRQCGRDLAHVSLKDPRARFCQDVATDLAVSDAGGAVQALMATGAHSPLSESLLSRVLCTLFPGSASAPHSDSIALLSAIYTESTTDSSPHYPFLRPILVQFRFRRDSRSACRLFVLIVDHTPADSIWDLIPHLEELTASISWSEAGLYLSQMIQRVPRVLDVVQRDDILRRLSYAGALHIGALLSKLEEVVTRKRSRPLLVRCEQRHCPYGGAIIRSEYDRSCRPICPCLLDVIHTQLRRVRRLVPDEIRSPGVPSSRPNGAQFPNETA